jgi:hypothetical protein
MGWDYSGRLGLSEEPDLVDGDGDEWVSFGRLLRGRGELELICALPVPFILWCILRCVAVVVIVGEGEQRVDLDRLGRRELTIVHLPRCSASSGELCGVHVRTGHPGHPARSLVGHHRVSWLALSFLGAVRLMCLGTDGMEIVGGRAILASILLDEKLGKLGVCGCASCLVSR